MKWNWYEKVIVITATIMVVGWLFADKARADMGKHQSGWSVEQGYISTSPEGDRFACSLGYWTPEFARYEQSLLCVTFDNPERYKGLQSGRLEKME